MPIDMAGCRFMVDVQRSKVVSEHGIKDGAKVCEVAGALKVRHGDGFAVNVHKSGRYRVVAIHMYIFERYGSIRAWIIEVFIWRLKKAKNEEER